MAYMVARSFEAIHKDTLNTTAYDSGWHMAGQRNVNPWIHFF